jgi:hypothetical protein
MSCDVPHLETGSGDYHIAQEHGWNREPEEDSELSVIDLQDPGDKFWDSRDLGRMSLEVPNAFFLSFSSYFWVWLRIFSD